MLLICSRGSGRGEKKKVHKSCQVVGKIKKYIQRLYLFYSLIANGRLSSPVFFQMNLWKHKISLKLAHCLSISLIVTHNLLEHC